MVMPSVPDPPEISDHLWASYDPAGIGFDVGANFGQSVPHMCQIAENVFAFEPNVESFAACRAQWSPVPQVHVMNIAVSDHDGLLKLAQLDGEQRRTGQLVSPGLMGMEWEPEDWSMVEMVQVPCRTLDSLATQIGTPGFIKVDTEGHEGAVLVGARRLISDHLPDWLIEFHSPEGRDQCLSILETMGRGQYELETVRHPHYPEMSRMWRQHGWIKAHSR